MVISETTLPRLAFLILTGRRPCVSGVVPAIHMMDGPLGKLVRVLKARNLVQTMDQAFPDMPVLEGMPGRGYYNDLHQAIETRLHASVGLKNSEGRLAAYSYAGRKAASDSFCKVIPHVLAAEWLRDHRPETPFYGKPPFQRIVERLFFDQEKTVSSRRWAFLPGNLLNACVALAWLFVWLVQRMRLRVPVETYALGAERLNEADEFLIDKALPDISVLIVARHKVSPQKDGRRPTIAGRPVVSLKDARVTPFAAVVLFGRACVDLAAFVTREGGADHLMFSRYCNLAAKRAMFAAFFRRFHVQAFWGRDDYSLDHVVRYQELRRIGGKAFGISHGIPINTYIPQWREIDFDVYYVFGRYLYDHYYRDAWAPGMTVKAVGTPHLTTERRKRLAGPRQADIIYFVMAATQLDKIVHEVWRVAAAFPDRQLWIKPKPNRDGSHVDQLNKLIADAPANVAVFDEAIPYEKMLTAGYAITSGSTLSAECLQFGMKTFVLDCDPEMRQMYYRQFPDLTVPDGDTIISRIKDIEAGREIYDFKKYDQLIDMSGGDFYQVVRDDLGLPAVADDAKSINI